MSLDAHPRVSDWLVLRDGRLDIRTGKVDIGQRISTALVGIVQQELDLPLEQIGAEAVSTDHSPNEGMTSGSNSIEQSGHALRCAAATLRARIAHHLCMRLGGEMRDWAFEAGFVTGPGTNRPIPLLDLVAGIGLDHPVEQDAPERAPAASASALPMRGLPELVRGSYPFIQDIDLQDMWHARVLFPPQPRAQLSNVDPVVIERLQAEGLVLVRDGSFVALAGPAEWPVVRGLQRLATACTWDDRGGLPEGDVQKCLVKENALRLVVLGGKPRQDVPVPPSLEAPTHSARYERPYTMHGALAPSAACATWNGTRLEVFTHSQGIYILRDSMAESLGLGPDDIVLRYMPSSGCYGHNGADDAALEAALIAMALPGRPVLLKRNREDEHAYEPYGPASATELGLRFDPKEGRITALSAEAIGGTFRGRPRSGPNGAGPARLLANHYRADPLGPQPGVPNMNRHGGLHRNLEPVYQIPETRLVKNLIPETPLRSSALRCLGAALNQFSIECLIDEIVQEMGLCPFAFRKAHLSNDARGQDILDCLAAKSAAMPIPEGIGRGIAYGQYKNSMTRVGALVDLAVTDKAEIDLKTVVMVADAGRVVDRDGLLAQLEGGALQAASWALYEEVTWDRDGVTSRDWNSYPVLRFGNVPQIETILLEPTGVPAVGAGEASPGPVLAAIANAVSDATGLRPRRLPMTPQALTDLALQA